MSDPADVRASRWSGRPVQSALLRAGIVAVPIVAGVAAASVFSHLVAYPESVWAAVGWWLGVFAISTVVVLVVERQARRLLPLVALLKLSMIFPDQAPSRFGVALRAGTVRTLEERREEMLRRGVDDEPARAAGQILELVGALSIHDRATRGHAERVRAYADLLGAEMGLTADDRDRLHWAALLHDVGKVEVPGHVLNKPAKLDDEEWQLIKRHPEEGARLAAPLRPWLGEWADTIVQHHERWDGMGYPKGLAGEEISRGARIVGVSDAFEVMTAARSYKKPMDVALAREELTRGAGAQFDPAAVRAFLNISLRRQRWIAGPVAWLSGLPFLNLIPGGLGGQVASIGARVLAASAVLAAVVSPAAGPAAPEAHLMAAPAVAPPAVVIPTPPAPAPAPALPPPPTAAASPTPAAAAPVPVVRPLALRTPTATTTTTTTTAPLSGPSPAPPASPPPTSPRPTSPPPTSPPPTAPPPTSPPQQTCVLTSVVQPVAPALAPAVEPVCTLLQA